MRQNFFKKKSISKPISYLLRLRQRPFFPRAAGVHLHSRAGNSPSGEFPRAIISAQALKLSRASARGRFSGRAEIEVGLPAQPSEAAQRPRARLRSHPSL